jgi:hypothetical protein
MPKSLVRVSINFAKEDWPRARQFLSAIGRPDLARAPQNLFGYTLKLGGEHEFLEFKAVAELFDFAKNLSVGRENRYTSRELESASLLSVRYTRRARGAGGPESGTRYDFDDGCPCCGTASRQISELFVKGSLPDQTGLIQLETGEWLLSQELADVLAESFRGAELRLTRAKRTGNSLPWLQVRAEATLPRIDAKTTGVVVSEQCVCCSRDGHFGTTREPFELHYAPQACSSGSDVMATWEHFGLSRLRTPRSDTVLAKPGLVISSRLFRGLIAQKVRGLAFTPVICDGTETPP